MQYFIKFLKMPGKLFFKTREAAIKSLEKNGFVLDQTSVKPDDPIASQWRKPFYTAEGGGFTLCAVAAVLPEGHNEDVPFHVSIS